MEHEKTPEALDDLISDIHELIDEKEPQQELQPAEPDVLQEPAVMQEPQQTPEEAAEELSEEEEIFQHQRWTERQRVPKHVAKLQQNQEEAYAKWLEEQEEKGEELPPELVEEFPEGMELPPDTGANQKKKKKSIGLWLCLIFVLLTVIAATVVTIAVPQQPKQPSELARVKGVSTILLAGTDDSLGRVDMLMLMGVDADGRTLSLVSLSAQTVVELDGETVTLGSVYGRCGGGQEGIAALKEAVGSCVGFVPDGCMVLYPDALTGFVDILGSVKMEVPYAVKSQTSSVSAGTQRLSAQESYTLLRHCGEDTDDAARMQTQQLFMSALVAQCTDLGGVIKSPALLDCLSRNSVTDLSTQNLLWLARTAMVLKDENTKIATLPGTDEEAGYVLDSAAVVQVINDTCNPHVRAVTEADLRILVP